MIEDKDVVHSTRAGAKRTARGRDRARQSRAQAGPAATRSLRTGWRGPTGPGVTTRRRLWWAAANLSSTGGSGPSYCLTRRASRPTCLTVPSHQNRPTPSLRRSTSRPTASRILVGDNCVALGSIKKHVRQRGPQTALYDTNPFRAPLTSVASAIRRSSVGALLALCPR